MEKKNRKSCKRDSKNLLKKTEKIVTEIRKLIILVGRAQIRIVQNLSQNIGKAYSKQ